MGQPERLIEIGFTNELLDDFNRARRGMSGPEAQFWRRVAYRSLFGFLEAWMSVNRDHFIPDILQDHRDRLVKTPEDQRSVGSLLAATDPEEWGLTDQGLGEPKKRKLRFLPQLKANVRLAMFVSGVPREEVERQLRQGALTQVGKAVKVRDRITHPHAHEDIIVGDEDVRSLHALAGLMQGVLNAFKPPQTPAGYNDSTEDGSPGTASG
jgi:hypothetical protein